MQPGRRRLLQLALTPSIARLSAAASLLPWQVPAAGGSVRRRLRLTVTFTNPLNWSLTDQKFWCYLPAHLPEFQQLGDVKVSMPHRVINDVWGHRVLELSFEDFAALGQKVVSITADAELNAEPQKPSLADPSQWLGAERFIESDDSRVRKAAVELRRATTTETAQAVYGWVAANVEYAGYLADDLGALHALLERRGDCTEYADLVVAMLRANGIPARMVGGYVVDRDTNLRPQDYHNWAEAYVSSAWRIVDAQKGRWLAPRSEYVTFRIYRDVATNPVEHAHRYRVEGQLQAG
jgi:transglutaminase-like putative cysteine protease